MASDDGIGPCCLARVIPSHLKTQLFLSSRFVDIRRVRLQGTNNNNARCAPATSLPVRLPSEQISEQLRRGC
jgi:hypothetical protein